MHDFFAILLNIEGLNIVSWAVKTNEDNNVAREAGTQNETKHKTIKAK